MTADLLPPPALDAQSPTTAARPSRRRRWGGFAVKLAVTVAALVIALPDADGRAVASRLAAARILFLTSDAQIFPFLILNV